MDLMKVLVLVQGVIVDNALVIDKKLCKESC